MEMELEATYTTYLEHRQSENRNLLNFSKQCMPKKLQFFGEKEKQYQKSELVHYPKLMTT